MAFGNGSAGRFGTADFALGALSLVTLVALAGFYDSFGLPFAVLRKRPVHIVHFIELSFVIAADVPFTLARGLRPRFSGISICCTTSKTSIGRKP